MTLKKTEYADDEIPIYDEAVIYKRGDYWQMRMWLGKEKKYARFSLRTRNRDTAINKAKKQYHELMAMELAGKTYFSLTTKQGVELYLEQRKKDIAAGLITEGRWRTIYTHLQHWLRFIGKDTKLKELHRTDCENYFHERHQTKKRNEIKISQSTIVNEQSSINAMMSWLFKKNESYIEAFDFKKLKPIDAGDLALKRPVFSKPELERISAVLRHYITEPADDKNDKNNATKSVCGCFNGIAMLTGMRRGEMLQLKWKHINASEALPLIKAKGKKSPDALFEITVPGAISKVRRTRQFMVGDNGYVFHLLHMAAKRNRFKETPAAYTEKTERFLFVNFAALRKEIGEELVFSIDGETPITPRAIYVHFENLIERAEIEDAVVRGIVHYSFRHSFITHKINSGVDLVAVAEMCGTSVAQIEKTYYRTTREKMRTNALSDYDVVGGTIVRNQA
jgi:integrase